MKILLCEAVHKATSTTYHNIHYNNLQQAKIPILIFNNPCEL